MDLKLFVAKGGFKPDVDVARADALQKALLLTPKYEDEDALDASPEWGQIMRSMGANLETQWILDLGAKVAMESNQDFSDTQYAYGLQAAGLVRAWNGDSRLARFNIFDYPFALTRFVATCVSGKSAKWAPSGRYLPTLLIGVDMVDPANNDTRLAVDPEEDPYPRLSGEIAFRSEVAQIGNKDLLFSFSLRHFQEIDPSDAITDADLDEQTYTAFSLDYGNVRITYADGKLPFDREEDNSFQIGLKFNI